MTVMKTIVLTTVMLAVSPFFAVAQSFTPDEMDLKERDYFDFLIGEWHIVQKKTTNGTTTGGRDTYTFRKGLDGNAILSEWYFNRGTETDPNYTEGLYYSAYDNLTDAWSFYYISAASAQYYEGKKEDEQWYFYREFTIEGNSFLQRQSWKLKNDLTLIRTIENSSDNGRNWEKVVVTTLRRAKNE